MAFLPKEVAPITISTKSSFKQCYDYYLDRAKLSENRLAKLARIEQSTINKIANNKIKNVQIDTLVCICLALGLTLEQTNDLLARRERALSPANDTHDIYKYLITYYLEKGIKADHFANNPEKFLEKADEILIERGKKKLPNKDL